MKLNEEQKFPKADIQNPDLEQGLKEAQSTIDSLQEEVLETNKGLIALTIELEDSQSIAMRMMREAQEAKEKVEQANQKLLEEIEKRKQIEEDLRKSRDQERYLAYHDSLTDLPNRLLFQDRLGQSLAQARRNGLMVATIFLDLDGFKIINDTLGHSIGDLLLQNVAERLTACIRETDTAARWGGDEFCVILNSITDQTSVAKVAEKILTTISKSYLFQDRELFITTSLGISLYPRDGEEEETLIKNADVAMYHAKGSGKSKCEFYDAKLSYGEEPLKRMEIENGLLFALDREEFQIYFQPQMDIGSGQIIGVEALIRWFHPNLGWISPGTFIPLAEETGMIIPIGNWVLLSACRQMKAWQNQGYPPVTVGVNVSALQFHQQKFVRMVEDVLEESRLDPQYLELEITENVVMKNTDIAKETLKYLKELGVKISIDDFGTGYSSLSYLKNFQIDKLKIDQSFIRSIAEEKADLAITQAIISMAHSLQLKAIAEGVETEEQREILGSMGCDEIQGYLFSRPEPAEKIIELIREHRAGMK